jgi:hypothetical protein
MAVAIYIRIRMTLTALQLVAEPAVSRRTLFKTALVQDARWSKPFVCAHCRALRTSCLHDGKYLSAISSAKQHNSSLSDRCGCQLVANELNCESGPPPGPAR